MSTRVLRHPLRRLGARRVVIGGTVTGLVLVGGLAAWSATGASAAASYRTVTAARGSVEQTLTATGTVTPRSRADVSFGTSGTVRAVDVAVGDHVDIGDTLATLDQTESRDAVTSAKATLANAKATLVADTTAQAEAVAAASSDTTSDTASDDSSDSQSDASGGNSDAGTSKATRKILAQLGKQQAALLAAQRDADAALQVSAAALTQQAAACDGVLNPDPEATDAPDVADCQTALGAAQAAQTKVAAAQRKVEKAIDTLTRSISNALRALSPTGSATGSGGASGSTPTPSATPDASSAKPDASSNDASSSSQSPSSGTVTAATLARDQSAIDTARAALVRAEAALDKARLTAPIAGTVAAVDITRGQAVSASTVVVVVNGDDGNVEVTIDVTENDIRAIEVGQAANVTADGAKDALHGKVSAIGLLSASDSGTASYPVVISLAGAPMSLASGSDATVSVVTDTASNVVTLPSSAVMLTAGGSTGVVRVLTGDTVTSTRVAVGAVGPVRTEITSGLKVGQRVVLADLLQELPSSSTSDRFGGGLGEGPVGVKLPAGGGPLVQRSGP